MIAPSPSDAMQTIPITDCAHYHVLIGGDILRELGVHAARAVAGRNAVLVCDTSVAPIYAQRAEQSLGEAHFTVSRFVFPAGEAYKTTETYLQLLHFLCAHELTRADCLIALGGGVVGDLAGFAAATYLRGIAYIQVPTTVLAMVDASVGAKTGLNLPMGKNLVGAFYAPKLVLCDTDTLASLPSDVFSDGCAEIVKYGVLFDAELFALLEKDGLSFPRAAVIGRCVALKGQTVALDPHDRGARRLLNFGHTVGHAIEKASEYTLSHGKAVAVGMCIVTKAAAAHGDCAGALYTRLCALLERLGLPTRTDLPLSALMAHIRSDKKRRDDQIDLIVPADLGFARVITLPLSQLETYIKAGM